MSLLTPTQPRRAHPGDGRIVLENVSWDYYLRTIAEFENSHVRVNYFRGRMELFMPGVKHERIKKAIARLLETYSLEQNIRISGLGSVTCHRDDVRAGLEPDECFYITTALPPLSPHTLEITAENRPDLAIEVDVFSSSVSRESIYATFGVPEIWRYDGQQVCPNVRRSDGTYELSVSSPQLPGLDMAVFSDFVNQAITGDSFDAAVAFKRWLHSQNKA